uniref:Ribosomal protein S16 n=1 Tax=Flammulina velutipes TaxID=38945 RepID=O78732_FLAVE|nr:ribosomal protein S16 [Flammulina velutipes]
MAIRLRWALHGVRHNRILHLVAINNRKARNAKPKELLGVYNPHVAPLVAPGFGPAMLKAEPAERRRWLSVGARPRRSVARMLERGGILTWESLYGSGSTTRTSAPQGG